jgi:hypothetical protein
MPARLERALRGLHRHPRRLREGLDRPLLAALLRDRVERGLGRFDLLLGIDRLACVERGLHHLASDADQRPEQCEVVDLRGKVARADQRRA